MKYLINDYVILISTIALLYVIILFVLDDVMERNKKAELDCYAQYETVEFERVDGKIYCRINTPYKVLA